MAEEFFQESMLSGQEEGGTEKRGKIEEKVLLIRRVARVTEGGKRFRFGALVAVGDGEGRVGVAYAKATEVADAIKKALKKARENMIQVKFKKGTRTIPHEVIGKFKASEILLKPAAPGTGVIANSSIRTILELAGYKDILSKALGSTNIIPLIGALFDALSKIQDPTEVAKKRGKTLAELFDLKKE